MKTKEFIEKVEALDFVGEAEKGVLGLIGFPNENGEALISVNEDLAYHFNTDYKAFRQLHLKEKRQLANIAWEYAGTPLEEREEEKKYVYKLPILSTGSSTSFIQKFFSAIRIASPDKKVDDLTGIYHFTDKEVEQYTGKSRLLFDACEKIEVTE